MRGLTDSSKVWGNKENVLADKPRADPHGKGGARSQRQRDEPGLALSTCLHAEKGDTLTSTLNTLVRVFERKGVFFTRSGGVEFTNAERTRIGDFARGDDRDRYAAV
jgi:hypothetical protein